MLHRNDFIMAAKTDVLATASAHITREGAARRVRAVSGSAAQGRRASPRQARGLAPPGLREALLGHAPRSHARRAARASAYILDRRCARRRPSVAGATSVYSESARQGQPREPDDPGAAFQSERQEALGTVLEQTSTVPSTHRVELLFSSKGVKRVAVLEERIRPTQKRSTWST
jgi:hypothetical protein